MSSVPAWDRQDLPSTIPLLPRHDITTRVRERYIYKYSIIVFLLALLTSRTSRQVVFTLVWLLGLVTQPIVLRLISSCSLSFLSQIYVILSVDSLSYLLHLILKY